LVSKKARGVLLVTLGGASALALSYGIGWAEGSAKSAAAQQLASELKAGHQKDSGQMQTQLNQARQRIKTLEARRQLHRSEMALELDNFGTAREHLATAHTLLMELKPTPGSELSELSDAISSVELGVAEDPLPQRRQLRELAIRFDAILGA
jgi:TolA-binding protein